VRDYEDAGISGVTLRERPALIQLLLDVDSPEPKFTTVLVYDVIPVRPTFDEPRACKPQRRCQK
jgi:hypothetical protein